MPYRSILKPGPCQAPNAEIVKEIPAPVLDSERNHQIDLDNIFHDINAHCIDVDAFEYEDIVQRKPQSIEPSPGYALVFPGDKTPFSNYSFALHDTLILGMFISSRSVAALATQRAATRTWPSFESLPRGSVVERHASDRRRLEINPVPLPFRVTLKLYRLNYAFTDTKATADRLLHPINHGTRHYFTSRNT